MRGVNETVRAFQRTHGVAQLFHFLKIGMDVLIEDVHDGGGVTNVQMVHEDHVHGMNVGRVSLLRVFGPSGVAAPCTLANCIKQGWVCQTTSGPTGGGIHRHRCCSRGVRPGSREPTALWGLGGVPPCRQLIACAVMGKDVVVVAVRGRRTSPQPRKRSHEMVPRYIHVDRCIGSKGPRFRRGRVVAVV